MLLFRRKNAVQTLCFLSCLSHIAIKTYCPWHGNCKAGACKPILTFPQSTSLFHIGEQSLWKNAWPLFLWTICVTEKNARVWFFLLPLVLQEKANSPQKLWAEKRLYNTCVCVCIWCGHLDPQVHFELSCTIKSHQADAVNSWDWGGNSKTALALKGWLQNRWDASLGWQSPRPRTRLNHDDQSTVASTRNSK